MASKTSAPVSISTPASGRLGALLRVPIDYMLEVYTGGVITTMITLPQTPSTYTQTRPSATVITHTLGEVVREITENHLTEIELTGFSGYTPRVAQTRTGGISFLNGREILEEFDKFLDEYQQRTAQNTDNVFMVFRALGEGQSFKVEPTEWRWSEDASQNRFSYKWELKLEAYAHAPADPRGSVFSPVTEALRTAQQYINAGAGAISLADNALTNARSELEEVRNVLRSLERVSSALSNTFESADGIKTFVTQDLPASFASLAKSYKRAYESASELFGVDENTARTAGYTAENINYFALVTAGIVGVNSADLDSAESAPQIERVESRQGTTNEAPRFMLPFTVRAGDTLQRIALSAYGDASRWSEIQDANGMRSARHHADGRPLRVGDVLQIPYENNTETDLGLARNGDIYATDLRMDNGDLALSDSDLITVTGTSNLEQAIANRLLTEQGSAWIFPAYGLPVSIGARMDARTSAFCASHVGQQLRADPRIRDVRDVVVIDDGEQLAVSVTAIPISGGAIEVTTPMRRA